jgi:hypothetical protein
VLRHPSNIDTCGIRSVNPFHLLIERKEQDDGQHLGVEGAARRDALGLWDLRRTHPRHGGHGKLGGLQLLWRPGPPAGRSERPPRRSYRPLAGSAGTTTLTNDLVLWISSSLNGAMTHEDA